MMSDPRRKFTDWLHTELVTQFAHESEPWATERVQHVMTRLNEFRPGLAPLECVILWVPPPVAFTFVGTYVYISRSLLQRLPSDDSAAFVLAHEAAHHDLGHFELYAGWTNWLPELNATAYVAALARVLEHKAYGPRRENDADDFAIRLCHRAGYNAERGAHALEILENLALDRGDVAGVYGPENLLDPTDPKRDSVAFRVQEWLWTHLHGYHPLYERVARARALARALRDGTVPA